MNIAFSSPSWTWEHICTHVLSYTLTEPRRPASKSTCQGQHTYKWSIRIVEIIWNVSAFCPSYLLKMNINRNVLKTQLLARTETEKVIRHMPYNSLLKCKIGCLCATITTLHFGILVPPQRWMNTVLLNCHSPNFPSPSIPDSH